MHLQVADPGHFGFGVNPDPFSDPDADPDPAIFVIDLPEMPTKNYFTEKFFCLLLLEGTCKSFSNKKSQKEVTKP